MSSRASMLDLQCIKSSKELLSSLNSASFSMLAFRQASEHPWLILLKVTSSAGLCIVVTGFVHCLSDDPHWNVVMHLLIESLDSVLSASSKGSVQRSSASFGKGERVCTNKKGLSMGGIIFSGHKWRITLLPLLTLPFLSCFSKARAGIGIVV